MTEYQGYAIFPSCNCPEIVCVQKHGAGYNDIIFVENIKKAIEVIDYLTLPEFADN